MNGTTLAHHTQLTDWCGQKRLQQDPVGLDILHKTKQSLLTPDKYESIGLWCAEVNRLLIKPPKREPPQLFRKCRYTDSMLPPNKSTLKSPATVPASATLWSSPRKKSEVRSAVLTGKAGVKARPQDTERGMEGERDTALAVKLAESMDYYVQGRKTVHLHIQPQWKRKLSTGWTINRPMLYPKVPPPPPPENLLVDIPDYLVRNAEKQMEVSSEDSPKDKVSIASSENFEIPKILNLSQQREGDETDKDTDEGDIGDVKSRGTQCQPDEEADEEESESDVKNREEETMTPRSRYKPIITDRSISNDILNVLSVDDCKMMLRYRPMRVIETQESMILPPAKPAVTHDEDNEDSILEEIPENTTTTQKTPIRLSQGSARTTLSPTQVQSRVHAYREMYDTYSKRTPEAKVPRPSSAAVEKAFEVLLDKNFEACQSSRRPFSSPPHFSPSRPSSRFSSHSAVSTAPSLRFQQLNATLRQQMYDFVDTRWFHTKMRFQRTKNGYAKSGMKKGRMITSSPKQSWLSEEDLVMD